MVNATDLQQRAAAMRGETPGGNSKERVEKVIKFFRPAEAIYAIKAEDHRVRIGRGDKSMDVVIRPMNPKTLVEAYGVLRNLLLPMISLAGRMQSSKTTTVSDLMDAFGENVADLPKLIFLILRRGNPNINLEYIEEEIDLVLDLQLILPHFLEQNGLDKLFGGKDEATKDSAPTTSDQLAKPPLTVESLEPSPSSADGTDGALVTSGTI